MSKNIIVSVTPNTIGDITLKLNKAENTMLKHHQDLKITDNTIASLTARKSTLEISFQRHTENLKLITQNLSSEQIKFTQANKTLEANKGVSEGWVENVGNFQKNYDVSANNKIIYFGNIKKHENDIALYQQAYDKSNSNRTICLDNIKYYDEAINEAQSSIQLCKNNRAVCSKNILTYDKNISIIHGNINEADRINQLHLDHIKKFNDALPTIIRAYGDHLEYPSAVNRETFYVDKEVRTKHKTSILGINAEPYYKSHNEKIFNQAGYDNAVASRNKERNTFDEKRNLINEIKEIIASSEEIVSSNNKIKSNAQITLSKEMQSKQTAIASKLSIEKNITETGNQVKNLQEEIARYNVRKKVQEENVRLAKEEINQINILVQNNLKNEQELKTKIAEANRINDVLKSQLNNLNKESEEELLVIIEEITFQEGATDVSTISNYIEKVDLAGNDHISEILQG